MTKFSRFKALNIFSFIFFILFSVNVSAADNIPKILSTNPNQVATGKNFVIATQGEAASKAGALIFDKGGNFVDAAVAISFAISVERPQSTGIGGGGFMLIYDAKNKKTFAVDFREKAPLGAKGKMFLDKKGEVIKGKSTEGIFAGAVPGTVAGLTEIHKRYGKLPLAVVMEPAIRLAENGFPIYDHLANAIKDHQELLKRYPASAKIFLNIDGSPKKSGDILIQSDLANTLKIISRKGRNGFYKGKVAKEFIAEEKRLGGLITQKDLDQYKVVWRKPVKGTYLGYTIESMPPPSSGGVHVIEILNILEQEKINDKTPYAPENIHKTVSAMQMAFADRSKYLGDSDFVKVPIKGLESKSYAKTLAFQIGNRARPSSEVKPGKIPGYESDQTTHFSIMDSRGNAVSSTQTINGHLGSGVVVPGAGFVINNEMDDFATNVGASNMHGAIGGNKNLISPGKRPLSSMSPTIIFAADGKPILALGSPGGTNIISCVSSVIINSLNYHMSDVDAVGAIRYHHQWMPDEIFFDASPRLDDKILKAITDMGYKISKNPLKCDVQLVSHQASELHAVSDPRGIGLAVGK